nr:MAG: structural protein [Eriocheir sinensis dicistro-like virus]
MTAANTEPPESKISNHIKDQFRLPAIISPAAPASGSTTMLPDAAEPNSAVERVQGITNFIDAEDTLADLTHASRTLITRKLMSDDETTEDIKKVLARPVFLTNLDWSSAQSIGTVLASFAIPQTILNASAIKRQKMAYNTFLNCDVVIRVVAAPMQLQAGRLWLAFEPYKVERSARAAAGFISQFTALPGVEYDPCKPAPVELRVPFQSLISSFNINTAQYGCGAVSLYVLSPLQSAASTSTITVSLQGWLENVSLRVPTQNNIATIPARSLGVAQLDEERIHGEPQVFQASREETNASRGHYFSRAATSVSNIATAMGMFPLLASVANPVASFASAVSRTAAYFGFAKPADLSAPVKFSQHNRAAWVNSDGPLPLVKLSHTSDNEVSHQDHIFPNPIDEMDIAYICSNPALINAYTWSTTDTVGKLISVIPVHPGLCNSVSGPGSYTYKTYSPTPTAYVASMFKYWAGSMKYRLEVVSTPFHAGRLVVAYFPDFNPLATYSITEIGNNYSMVWDVTDSTHCEFEVPYVSNVPFKQVFLDDQSYTTLLNGDVNLLSARDRIKQVSNGAIVVFVLNQLVVPASASTTVAFLNWVSGGKDITFAEPVLGAYKPVTNSPVKIDYTGKWYDGSEMSEAPFPVKPTRMGAIFEHSECEHEEGEDTVDCDQMFQSAAPTNLVTPGIDPKAVSTGQYSSESNFIPMHYIDREERAKMAFGEVVTNLRTLTRRLTPAYVMYPQAVTASGAWSNPVVPPTNLNVLTFDPDYFGTGSGADDDAIYQKQMAPARVGNTNWLTELTSSLSYVSHLYAFARGSRVYGISTTPSATINASAFSNLSDETTNTGDSGLGTWDMRLSLHNDMDSPPRQPYFRPEDNLLGYDFANTSSATLSTSNFSYGFNSALSGNMAVQKAGEQGCALVVQVPPTTNLPFRLIAEPNLTEPFYMATVRNNAPRSRRFLEVRYRPFQSALSGGTATYTPKIWPFPTTFLEAGADDFSFGGLVPPPRITKVTKHNVFTNYGDGSKLLL